MGPSVMLVDDQRIFTEGLRSLIQGEPDMHIVGRADNGLEALEIARETDSDIILMDVRMPRCDGIEATAELLHAGYCGRIVILTAHASAGYLSASLGAGASGYLLKSQRPEEILAALQCANLGNAVLAPKMLDLIDREFLISPEAADFDIPLDAAQLSQRELDVLTCIVRGLSNEEIAHELALKSTTVKSHVTRLLRKLGVRDRLQAALIARNAGLRGTIVKEARISHLMDAGRS